MPLFAIPCFKALKLTFLSYQFYLLFACYWFFSPLPSVCLMETELMGLCFVYSLLMQQHCFDVVSIALGIGLWAAARGVHRHTPFYLCRFSSKGILVIALSSMVTVLFCLFHLVVFWGCSLIFPQGYPCEIITEYTELLRVTGKITLPPVRSSTLIHEAILTSY